MKPADIVTQLRANGVSLLLVHLYFSLLGITLLAPLFALTLQGLVELSGSSAVADQDIARLILSPAGMTGLVFLLGLFLAILSLEAAAMLALVSARRAGHRATPLQCVLFVLRQAPQLLLLTIRLVARILVYLLPYLAVIGAIAWWLLTDYDINYYLSHRPTEFYVALGLAAVPTAILIWRLGRRLLGWSLILPLVMYGGVTPAAAFARSEDQVRGDKRLVIRALLTWLAMSLLLAAIPALFLAVAWKLVLISRADSLVLLVFFVGLQMVGWVVLNFLASALSLASLVTVIDHLQTRLAPAYSLDNWQQSLTSASSSPLAIRLSPGRLLAIGLIAAIVAAGAGHWLVRGMVVEDNALVIAHRGAAGAAPENTLAAVQRAIEDGADWVEIDVQESRDGKVIVVHDSDFMKLAGNPLKVWEGDLAEIQEIDIGSWFGPEFSEERTPTLEQVLMLTRDRATLLIELKYYGHDVALEQRVVDIVESMDMADQVIAMSLHLPGVKKLKALRPSWTVGLLAATAVGDLTRLDVDFLAVNAAMASPAFIRRAQAAGKPVHVWTINDALSMTGMLSRGVDGLITDEPALAREVLSHREDLGPTERLLLSAALLFGKPLPSRTYRDNSP